MTHRRAELNLALLLILGDLALTQLALWLAHSGAIISPAYPLDVPLSLLAGSLTLFILITFAVYDTRNIVHLGEELRRLGRGVLVAGVGLAGVLYMLGQDVPRRVLVLFFVLDLIFLIGYRLLVRQISRYISSSEYLRPRRVLVVGRPPDAQELIAALGDNPARRWHYVGYIDGAEERPAEGYLGEIEAAATVIERHKIDDVVIAFPYPAQERLDNLVSVLFKLPVDVMVVPSLLDMAFHRAGIEDLAGLPLISLTAPVIDPFQRVVKRVFDLLVVLVVLPVLALPILLLALLVKLDSPGPAFFRQVRVGEFQRRFKMYKLRTMYHNAAKPWPTDAEGHLLPKVPDDPRVTRIGRFLRKTSLDELPQILNVLKGDMSLVGPRPEIPELVEKYAEWQYARFLVPQGLTGWWQINGRSEKPMFMHTDEDLYYVRNYSLWLDIVILIRTPMAVLSRRGAF